MDFILEALLNLIGQLLFEWLAEKAMERAAPQLARFFSLRIVRTGIAGVIGFTFGCIWGAVLSGPGHREPRLLYVSLAFGGAALMAASFRGVNPPRTTDEHGRSRWSVLLELPTSWGWRRWIDVVVLNAGIVLGILATFSNAAKPLG